MSHPVTGVVSGDSAARPEAEDASADGASAPEHRSYDMHWRHGTPWHAVAHLFTSFWQRRSLEGFLWIFVDTCSLYVFCLSWWFWCMEPSGARIVFNAVPIWVLRSPKGLKKATFTEICVVSFFEEQNWEHTLSSSFLRCGTLPTARADGHTHKHNQTKHNQNSEIAFSTNSNTQTCHSDPFSYTTPLWDCTWEDYLKTAYAAFVQAQPEGSGSRDWREMTCLRLAVRVVTQPWHGNLPELEGSKSKIVKGQTLINSNSW